VAALHREKVGNLDVPLGSWVGYVRHRRRKNQLSEQNTAALSSVHGFEWGPLSPGPPTNSKRNQLIREARGAGNSLSQIADMFELSRQRVHQIVHNVPV